MTGSRILYLVDTLPYVRENCFQRQLFAAMNYCYDIRPLEVLPPWAGSLRRCGVNLDAYDKIISVLRLRTLHRLWPQLKAWLGGRPITIYDQDPWESFIDDAPTKGIYKTLLENLKLEKVYVTAPWWARRLQADRVPADFVRMGMEPRWCDPGPVFEDRKILVGFRGALHPHRKVVFDQLTNVGIKVEIGRDRLDYPGYMAYMQQVKFFAHDESAPWICDGEGISRSTGMWIKSVETASRGTFCLRNAHPEGVHYGTNEIPLILCYQTPEEAPDLVNRVLSMNPGQIRDMQVSSVEYIRKRYDWIEAAQTMVKGGTQLG